MTQTQIPQIICDEENYNYFAIVVFILAFIIFRSFKTEKNQKIQKKKLENSKKFLERFKEENEEFFCGEFFAKDSKES